LEQLDMDNNEYHSLFLGPKRRLESETRRLASDYEFASVAALQEPHTIILAYAEGLDAIQNARGHPLPNFNAAAEKLVNFMHEWEDGVGDTYADYKAVMRDPEFHVTLADIMKVVSYAVDFSVAKVMIDTIKTVVGNFLTARASMHTIAGYLSSLADFELQVELYAGRPLRQALSLDLD
jgi:hypothetical protein